MTRAFGNRAHRRPQRARGWRPCQRRRRRMMSAPHGGWEAGPSTVRRDDFDFTALRAARVRPARRAMGLAYLDLRRTARTAPPRSPRHTALANGVFGNPHSERPVSRRSTAVIERARRQVLLVSTVDESTHDVCFTPTRRAAIKLVARAIRGPRTGGFVLVGRTTKIQSRLAENTRARAAPPSGCAHSTTS